MNINYGVKNNVGWDSEYRKTKFEKRYNKNKEYVPLKDILEPLEPEEPKTIAVMLDVEGTCDNIDDEKAKLFVRSLDVIRQKFGAKYGTISMSTHCNNSRQMKKVLEILSRNLSKHIKIGTNFFYGGVYDFESDREMMKHPDFNRDKVGTFMSYYTNRLGSQNVWFALIDDDIPDNVFSRCEASHPVLIAKPSSRVKDLTKNSFVRIASTTKGFDGVLEIMSTYLESIRHMTPAEIKETQKNMMMHLSSSELVTKITNREYVFLKRYFEEGYADEDDYEETLDWLLMTNHNKKIGKEELAQLNEIFRLIGVHFHEKGLKHQEERTIAFQNTLKEKKTIIY